MVLSWCWINLWFKGIKVRKCFHNLREISCSIIVRNLMIENYLKNELKVRSVKCGNWFFCSVDVALFGFQNESICQLKDGPTCYWSIPMYNYNNVMCNALYVMSTISSFFTQFLMMQVSSSATQYIASTVSVPYYWPNDHTMQKHDKQSFKTANSCAQSG